MDALFLGPRPRHGRKATIGVWTVAILLAILFISVGLPKLVAQEMQVEEFQHWGYPIWLMFLVGGFEVLFGLLLLLPATRFLAASAFVLEMVGALFTHLRVQEFAIMALPATVLMLAAFLAWMERPERVRKSTLRPSQA